MNRTNVGILKWYLVWYHVGLPMDKRVYLIVGLGSTPRHIYVHKLGTD